MNGQTGSTFDHPPTSSPHRTVSNPATTAVAILASLLLYPQKSGNDRQPYDVNLCKTVQCVRVFQHAILYRAWVIMFDSL